MNQKQKDEMNKRQKERVAQRKINGLCIRCGKNSPKKGFSCEICNKKRRNKRKENNDSGLCSYCGKDKPVIGTKGCERCNEIYSNARKRYLSDPTKKKKARKTTIKWLKNNPANRREIAKKHYHKLKEIIFNHYGRKCVCCGESFEFLTLDHINNDGNEQRKKFKRSTYWQYRDIIDAGFPNDLQPLCWNCNLAKYLYGECPHRKE